MKITQEPGKFRPVSIVLESLNEVSDFYDFLKDAMGKASLDVNRKIPDKVIQGLKEHLLQ